MNQSGPEKYRTFSFYISQLILYLFFLILILIFFFLIGNFQGFQDNTQLMILDILQKAGTVYLVLSFVYLIQCIGEIIMIRKASTGFLIFLFLSALFIFPVHLLLAFAGQLFFRLK